MAFGRHFRYYNPTKAASEDEQEKTDERRLKFVTGDDSTIGAPLEAHSAGAHGGGAGAHGGGAGAHGGRAGNKSPNVQQKKYSSKQHSSGSSRLDTFAAFAESESETDVSSGDDNDIEIGCVPNSAYGLNSAGAAGGGAFSSGATAGGGTFSSGTTAGGGAFSSGATFSGGGGGGGGVGVGEVRYTNNKNTTVASVQRQDSIVTVQSISSSDEDDACSDSSVDSQLQRCSTQHSAGQCSTQCSTQRSAGQCSSDNLPDSEDAVEVPVLQSTAPRRPQGSNRSRNINVKVHADKPTVSKGIHGITFEQLKALRGHVRSEESQSEAHKRQVHNGAGRGGKGRKRPAHVSELKVKSARNRPIEMVSTFGSMPPSIMRMRPGKSASASTGTDDKDVAGDPRFRQTTGVLNVGRFGEAYAFLDDLQQREKDEVKSRVGVLRRQLRDQKMSASGGGGGDARAATLTEQIALKKRLQQMVSLDAHRRKLAAESEMKSQFNKGEKETIKRTGKRDFHTTKRQIRKKLRAAAAKTFTTKKATRLASKANKKANIRDSSWAPKSRRQKV